MKAKDIMNTEVITIDPKTKIEDIAKILSKNSISGVPVVEDEKIVGIVSEGDLLHKEASPRIPTIYPVSALGSFIAPGDYKKYESDLKKFIATEAEQIMSKKVITSTEDTDIRELASIMVDKRVNRVPIVKNDKLIGIVTRADIIRNL